MKYGLSEDALKKLHHVFSCEENIEQVILYGSRAKGNYKPFSDVDIVLSGDKLEFMDLYRVILTIDDLLLPYLFDISLYKDLDSPKSSLSCSSCFYCQVHTLAEFIIELP